MRMDFKNLGPIKEGSFEPGKLTIITGNNNSGKTYITYTYFYLIREILTHNITNIIKEKLIEDQFPYKIHVDELLSNEYDKDKILYFLSKLFVVEKSFFKNFAFNLEKSDLFINKYSFMGLNLDELGSLKIVLEDKILNIKLYKGLKNDFQEKDFSSLSLQFSFLSENLIKDFKVLTSERANIASFYKELDQSREDIINEIKFENDGLLREKIINLSDYNYFIRKNISWIRAFRKTNDKHLQTDFFYKKIWNPLLKGDYTINNKSIFYRINKENEIPLKMTSSSIKSLYLFDLLLDKLTFITTKFIIIDEPELNLHPYNQLLMARLIAYLINKGKQVVITTHSEYIIRELNDLIALNNLSKENRKKFYEKYDDYSDEIVLNHEDVKAYTIKDSILKELDVDSNGVAIDSFDNTIDYLNKKSCTLRDLYEF